MPCLHTPEDPGRRRGNPSLLVPNHKCKSASARRDESRMRNTMLSISRRELLKQASMLPAAAALGSLTAQAGKPGRMLSTGWSWEGHGFTGGVGGLSIFGVGEGAKYW